MDRLHITLLVTATVSGLVVGGRVDLDESVLDSWRRRSVPARLSRTSVGPRPLTAIIGEYGDWVEAWDAPVSGTIPTHGPLTGECDVSQRPLGTAVRTSPGFGFASDRSGETTLAEESLVADLSRYFPRSA